MYGAALDWKGPGGRGKMKLWHELSKYDRRAFRLMYEQMRLQLAGGDMSPVPTPKPVTEMTLLVSGPTSYTFRKIERDDIRSITDLRKLLTQMDERAAAIEEEISPRFREQVEKARAQLEESNERLVGHGERTA